MSTLRVNKIQPNSKEAISIDGNVNITGSLVHNGHTTLAGTNVLSGSTTFIGETNVTGDLTVGGTLTAQEVRTEFDNASVVFESGSTKFGNSNDDIHNFKGSMNIDDGIFKVTNAGDDVLVTNPRNGTFVLGDTQELDSGALISGDANKILVKGLESKVLATYDAHNYYSGIGIEAPSATFHINHPSHAKNSQVLKVDSNGNQLLNITNTGDFELGDKGQVGDGGYIAHDSETFSIHSLGGSKVADFNTNEIKFTRNLHIKAIEGADATITLESDTDNVPLQGENDNPAILFKQDGSSKNAAVGFNIIDDTAGGTIAGTGNRFWIVNSVEDTIGQGGITFGTAEEDGWENAIARFMIRGDGKGLFGHPNNHYDKALGSQFEIYDDRTENTTSDYTLSAYGYVDIAEYPPSQGAGGIISRIKIVDGATDLGTHAIGMVAGKTSSEILTTGDFAFYAGSDMDTSGATGFAGKIFSGSNNWVLADSSPVSDSDYRLTVDGHQLIKNALTVQEEIHLSGDILQAGNARFSSDEAGIIWSRNTDGASIRFYNTADNDPDSRLEFNTRDNNNEYFRWTHTTANNELDDDTPGGVYESMRLSPINSGSNSILKVSGDILADSLTIGETNTNSSTETFSSILGGRENTIEGSYSIIGAGVSNEVSSSHSIIGAGKSNTVKAAYSSIAGGTENKIEVNSEYGTINGGKTNNISSALSFIGGGIGNDIQPTSDSSAIVGGKSNLIASAAEYSFIGGGSGNKFHGDGSTFGTIVGGRRNCIWGEEATGLKSDYQFIGGGTDNTTKNLFATVVGGTGNTVEGEASLIVGGRNNKLVPDTATIVGGQLNTIDDGVSSNIVGGQENRIENSVLTNILGGFRNEALGVSNYSSLLGGQENKIEEGIQSVIAGGRQNCITTTEYSSILGGQDNLIDRSQNSSIIGNSNSLQDTNSSHIIGSSISVETGQSHTTYVNNIMLTGSAAVPLSGIMTLQRLETTPSKKQLIGGSIFHSGSAGAGCLYFTPDGITIQQIKLA